MSDDPFSVFRRKAREAGIVVDHHRFTEPMWSFMPFGKAIAIRPGYDKAKEIIDFAALCGVDLMRGLEWHYALISMLQRDPLQTIRWTPFEPVEGPGANVAKQAFGYRALREADVGPGPQNILFRDWYEEGLTPYL